MGRPSLDFTLDTSLDTVQRWVPIPVGVTNLVLLLTPLQDRTGHHCPYLVTGPQYSGSKIRTKTVTEYWNRLGEGRHPKTT